MKINKLISRFNFSSRSSKVEYIVIHWVGAVSKAVDNAKYFYGGDRQSSAHFFVDANSIWQSVNTGNASWHCGGGLQGTRGHTYYGKCKNDNSIGIELCCIKKDGKLIVDPKAITMAAPLVQKLMNDYNIPSSRVIRHYDVTGKICPGTLIDEVAWNKAKRTLVGSDKITKKKVGYTGEFPTGICSKSQGTKENIKRWQKYLKWYGSYKGAIDGSFGPQTVTATKRFQKENGLNSDGSCGPKTISKAKTVKK